MRILLSAINAKYIHSSLAIRSLAAYCRPLFPSIEIEDYSINNKVQDILADVYARQPDVVGLSCYIWNREMVLELAQLIRQVLPQTVIVLGGPEVSYDACDVLTENPAVDYVVQGEGEETFRLLLKALEEKNSTADIVGLGRRTDGGIIAEGVPQVVGELGTLPFMYTEDDLAELKDKIIYYESTRGCPFSCRYCLSSATQGVRYHSKERVLQELKFFIKAGVRQVKFVDRTFNADPKHYLPILRFLSAAETKTNFHFEISADYLTEEALDILCNAPHGRFQLEIGIQSTHLPTLAAITRRNNWGLISANVRRLREAGRTHLHLDLIAGLPCESYERFAESFNDVFGLRPHMLQLGFLKMLKGSEMRNNAATYGYEFMQKPPYEVLSNDCLPYEKMRRLKIIEDILEEVYNSGRFEQTVNWFVEIHNNAFQFFEELSFYWEEKGYHRIAHSAKSIALYIVEYCRKKYPQHSGRCKDLLKFDALNIISGRVKADFLDWNDERTQLDCDNFWRSESLVGKYIADYKFNNWREQKRLYHIELFDRATVECLCGKKANDYSRDCLPILFDYRGIKPQWQVIAAEDFERRGGQNAL